MTQKTKHNSFHSFLRKSTLTLLVLILFMSGFMYCSYHAMIENHKIIDDSRELIVASDYLQKGSDKLTENIRFFVLTKDEKYAEKFIAEAYTVKTRDKVFEISNSHYFDVDYTKLETVKAMSDSLLQKELWLMRLVFESKNHENIPSALSQVILTEDQWKLNAIEKYELAKNYLLFGEYNVLKNNIDLMIADVNEELNLIASAKISETNQTTYFFLICQAVIFVLFVVWCVTILYVLNIHIVKPIRAYKKIYEKSEYNSKNLSLVRPNGMEEVYQLGQVYNQAMLDLNQLKCIVEEKNEELEIQKNIDPLTGVFNRGIFESPKWRELENSDFTIFYIDINKFKKINDTYGHLIGDKVLQFITLNLQSVIRKTDLIIRIGGDEFILVVKEMIEDEIIARIEHKLRALQGKILNIDEYVIPTFFSYGFAIHRVGENSFEEVLNVADRRLYMHKQTSNG